jgi:hypothetical protein
MFIINPDPYSLPVYRIGPFRTADLAINHCLPDSDLIDDYLSERFAGKELIYTENGRSAINTAIHYFKPAKNDVVTILTSSGNFYISGCVTGEIEKFCKWSRKIEPETKIIFVNHEFGYPYPKLTQLKMYNIPIIEDCAGSFLSDDADKAIGNVGDFVIYSFPKMFPLQVGGLLVSNTKKRVTRQQVESRKLRHIKNVLSNYIDTVEDIKTKRIHNYEYLKSKFESLGLTERFKSEDGVVPGVFMFKTEGQNIDLPELKKYFYAHGVQCSVFYGEDAFFIPVHQALCEYDLLYFYEVTRSFIQKSKNEILQY